MVVSSTGGCGLTHLHDGDTVTSRDRAIASLRSQAESSAPVDLPVGGRPVAGGRAQRHDAAPQWFAIFEDDHTFDRLESSRWAASGRNEPRQQHDTPATATR